MSFKFWPRFVVPVVLSLAWVCTQPSLAADLAADMQASGGTRAVVSEGGHLSIRHERFRLANGFEVILVEDHRLPLVAFNLWVHAGPRNESTGQTGFAHLFEHLMFAGSRHIPRGRADQFVEGAGGTDSNGSTDFDRTNYFFTLPSNQLELGLWIKSDMLGYMIDEVDAVALANQQDVVRNERRQSIENRPYGVVEEAAYQALFPEGHPYRAMVMGSHADIQSIQLADVKAFARTYYRPNNATLVLAGDFDPREARRLVEKYFGTLKAGPTVPPVAVTTPVIDAERRLLMTDQVELPRLDMLWLTSPLFQPGDADLDVAASILGGGKASRLYKKLVVERQSAQSVSVEQSSQSLNSVFWLQVLARKSASLDAIEADVDAELADLATKGPSDAEVQRARAEIETQMVARLEKVGALADTVNYYNQQAGDPDFAGKDLARYRAVTPESVRAAVAAQLRRQARVLVQTQPGDKHLAPEVPTPPSPKSAGLHDRESLNAPESWRLRPPRATAAHALSLPQAHRFVLANGLTVLHVEQRGLPLVSAALVLRAGQSANPLSQPGLSSFTAAMLQEGSSHRSGQAIADEMAGLGASFSTGSGHDDARLQLSCLTSAFPKALAVLADVAMNPAFNEADVARLRQQRLGALAQQRDQAAGVAAVWANQLVYGSANPLGFSSLGHEDALAATTPERLRTFWQAHYRPDQAALVVSGDIGAAELHELSARLFGGWVRPDGDAPVSIAVIAAPVQSSPTRLLFVDKPGAAQTALAVVQAGPRADAPDAASVRVMNAALGGLFTSRINHELREVKGYTYGIYSSYAMERDSGMFSVRGDVRSDVTGAALAELFKQLQAMRATPLGRAELEKARNAELLALPGLYDTNVVVANSYASRWALGLADDSVVKLPGQIAAVTVKSAYQALREHLDPERLVVVAVGDRAQALPQLKAWGRQPLVLGDVAGHVLPPALSP